MDLRTRDFTFDMPVHLISGRHDLLCPPELARDFLAGVEAPTRVFHSFAHSGHSPMWDEPDRFAQVMRAVLAAVR